MKKFQEGGIPQPNFAPRYQFPRRVTNPNARDSANYLNYFNAGVASMTGPQSPYTQRNYGNLLLRKLPMANPMGRAAYMDVADQGVGAGLLKPFQSGGSIVDFLKSQGKGSSKAERQALAQSMGFKGDFSAEDNLALLSALQTPQASQAVVQGFDNRMVATPDVDPNTGQPIEMMINSPQLVDLYRPEATSPVASRVRPVKKADPRNAPQVSRRSTSEMISDRSKPIIKANPKLDGDKSSYEGTDKFFQRASWMLPSSRRPAAKNPVANIEKAVGYDQKGNQTTYQTAPSNYKQQVLDGKLRGKDLAKLRSSGKISDREYNQLYSVLRNNGIL